MSNTEYLFILGCHKSGTSLLRSLFDGQDDTFVVPIESHFFRLTGHWINYPLKRSQPKKMAMPEKMNSLCEWIKYCNKVTDNMAARYSDSATKGIWDEGIFTNEMQSIEQNDINHANSDAYLYNKYIKAMFASLNSGKVFDKRLVVEKSVEHFDIAPIIKKTFPSAKFIHIVRNPYANIVALRKKCKKYPFLVREIYSIYGSLYKAQLNSQLIQDYKVVKYEDLVQDPKEVMQEIAIFAGLSYSDDMLSPTSRGEHWAGNSTSNTSFSSISTNPLNGWISTIDNIEIALINELFGGVLENFGYERIPTNASIYHPGSREYPVVYILNRLLCHYLRIWNKRLAQQL